MAVYLGSQPVNVYTGGQPSISLEEKTISAGASDIEVTPTAGKYLSKVTVQGDGDLIAENIKEGVDIFGVTGTFAGSTGQYVWAKYEIISYLSFIGNEDFTLKTANTTANWDGVLEYSTDTSTWNTWNGTEISSAGSKLYLRGTGNTIITGKSMDYRFIFTGTDSLRINCKGNIENLLDYQTVINGEHPVTAKYCYSYMFNKCTNLKIAPELSATTLASYCYSNMFNGCTNLTTAPELPATILDYSCYENMFNGCTSLKIAPELPATTLAYSCYSGMFYGCTSLTTVPELPATTLTDYCYINMFNGCKNLTALPALPTTTLTTYCYEGMFSNCTNIKLSTTQTGEYQTAYRIPTSGTGTTTTDALKIMFGNTGGTFTGTPEINTTYYTSNTVI